MCCNDHMLYLKLGTVTCDVIFFFSFSAATKALIVKVIHVN